MPWTDEFVETERVRLRPFRDDDKPAIVALESDPEVQRFLGGPASDELLDAIRSATVGERWGSFCVARLASDDAIGLVAFSGDRDLLEVSYQLTSGSWGRGLATEAVGAALAWAWANTPDPAIIAVTQTANERSLRLLARLGFVTEAEFEEFGAPQSQLRLVRPPDDPI